MKNPKLIIPCEKYLQSYLNACFEFKEHHVNVYHFHDPDTFDDWKSTIFENMEDFRLGKHLPERYVPASTFWLVEENEFIGAGSIRHSLTPALERFGGHIGYAVRYSKWNQGYGVIQLQLLLQEAKKIGLDKVLLTCNEDNIASARVMEKNGGIYWDTIENTIDGIFRKTKRYWITIQ